ncbi:MAG TPA: response regulator, partial [Anaerolineales bacterium]|nr:response regulator [Anaerolineales bacterium]
MSDLLLAVHHGKSQRVSERFSVKIMISAYTMSMRVLLVEDEHKIAAYVKRSLQETGYAVDAVFTGKDALDWVGAAPYDLIILDIMLPVIDGLTVCRELRQRGDRTPVLML